MEEKVIELNELDQKNLFCAAWHLTNFIEDYKEDKTGNFSTPCETCKYQTKCNFDAYSYFQTLTELTGVIITPFAGARELVKQGKFNLLKDEAKELVTISKINKSYFINNITREIDLYLKYRGKDYLTNNYIYDKYRDVWPIRCTGATRGHIKVDENDIIQEIELYKDTDGIYKSGVRECFEKYIGMKIVLEDFNNGMQTCKR